MLKLLQKKMIKRMDDVTTMKVANLGATTSVAAMKALAATAKAFEK